MIAVISDIHSNLEALEAVLADIDRRGADRIVCLGDVVGYGPNPRECLDRVRERATVALMGNHDWAVLYEPKQFNAVAEGAAFWTRRQLETEPDAALRGARWEFLATLEIKQTLQEDGAGSGDLTFVHGSPRRPVNEYIFPDDVYGSAQKVQGLFDRFGQLCFVGHTHVPGVFVDTPDFYSPEELDDVYPIDALHQALINVGSVGQPRDRDPRASYVLVEGPTVRFVRVEYDVEAVARKVHDIQDLDDSVGLRLAEGR